MGYTYDELGRVLNRSIDGANNTTTAAFDVLGRVSGITNPLGAFAFTYVNATGRLASASYPNSQITDYAYWPNQAASAGNGDQRLKEIANLRPGGANLSTFGYSYDKEGIIQTWTRKHDAGSVLTSNFKYDLADQLTEAAVPSTASVLKEFVYRYDKASNRTSEQIDGSVSAGSHNNLNQLKTLSATGPIRFEGAVNELANVTVNGVAATVDSSGVFKVDVPLGPGSPSAAVVAVDGNGTAATKNYQVTVASGTSRTLTYDPNGNMLNNGAGQAYEWDAADRLVKITQTSGVTEFVYDGAGRRVKEKLNGTEIKRWVWCGEPQPCEERDASNTVTKRFYAGLGEQIGGGSYFYTTDHLGSVREMTDSTGAVRARYDYDPYGRTSKTSGNLEATFGFTGFYRHQATNLDLTHFRAYDSGLGSWLSRDPIEEEGGINLYSYCTNNPISLIDLLGLDVTVSVYPGESGNPGGHVDIRVNNNAPVGFAPAPRASTLDLIRDKPVPGIMEPTAVSKKAETTVTIRTTPKQDAAIQGYIDRKTKSPGPYQISGPNCSTTVHNALNAGGIKSDYTRWPRDLIKSLQPK